MGGINLENEEVKRAFAQLEARILRVRDGKRRREALKHLERLEELVGLEGSFEGDFAYTTSDQL